MLRYQRMPLDTDKSRISVGSDGSSDVIMNTSKLRVTGLCEGNWPVNSPHKGPVTRKMFPFDDAIMLRQMIWHHPTTINAIWPLMCPRTGYEPNITCLSESSHNVNQSYLSVWHIFPSSVQNYLDGLVLCYVALHKNTTGDVNDHI